MGTVRSRNAPPVMQRMSREVDLTEVVKYEDVMWSLTLHCDNRSSSYDDHGRDSENSQANTVQWKDPSLRHLTPTMLSLLEAPQTVLQSDLSHRCHSVQRLFGVKDIMLNPPAISNSIFIPIPFQVSLYGVALALHNINCTLPVFTTVGAVPDYIGVAVPAQYGGRSVIFSSKKQMRKPTYNFSNLSTTTSTFLSKLGVTSVNTNPVNITVRHSWGYAVSSTKASSSGSTRHDSNINSNDSRGRAMESDNGNNDAAVRSWWRSPGEWGPLDDPVHSVTVYTIWPRFKSGTFVDNDSYSDLVASQAPEWYIRATFKGDMDLPLSSATNRLVYENTNP